MTRIVRTETRKRGFFGWLFLLLFIGFNVFMALWMVGAVISLSQEHFGSEVERAGAAIGGTLGFGIILTLWVFGDVILGLFALLSRGRKIIVEQEVRS